MEVANFTLSCPCTAPCGSKRVKENWSTKVDKGTPLLILEAMKMNNPIRATAGGVVKAVYVTVGQQVQHGTPLFHIAD